MDRKRELLQKDDAVGLRATRQHGAISRGQLRDEGLSDDAIARRVRSGQLVRVFRGIFVLRGSPATWMRSLWIARLWAGDDAVFSHRTAALCHGLDGITQEIVELTLPRRTRPPAPEIHIHFRASFRPETIRRFGLPVTSVPMTLMDLGAVSPAWRVELALDDALRRRLVSVRGLAAILDKHGARGVRGTRILRELLADRPEGLPVTGSPLETDLVKLLTDAPLPAHERQHPVQLADRTTAYLDVAYPQQRVGVEADGYRWHSGRGAWQRDLERHNKVAEVGWVLLRFTYHDIHRRPRWVVGKIARTLRTREPFRLS